MRKRSFFLQWLIQKRACRIDKDPIAYALMGEYLIRKGLKILPMNSSVQQLVALLEKEANLYQALLSLIFDERNALIDSDLARLNAAGKEKENLYLKLRILEEQRSQLLTQLARMMACPSSELTLSRLSQKLTTPYADRLNDCSRNLVSLLEKVQKASRHNKGLFNHSIELIRGSFNLFSNLLASGPVYYRTGDIQKSNHTGAFLCNDV